MPENSPTDYTEENDPSGLTDVELLSGAREEFKAIQMREKQPREEYERCTRFLALQQWNDELVNQRGWNIPSLVIDQLGPIKSQIVNDWIRNRMGIIIGPGDEIASEETAKIFSGYTRNVEYLSKGVSIYDMGFGHMVGGGQGYVGLLTRRKPGTFKQELFIRGFEDPMAVYCGKFSEIDQSDLYELFKRDSLSETEFKRQHKDALFDDFADWGSDFTDWYNATSKEVALAEYWKIWFKKRMLHRLERAIQIERAGQRIQTDAVYDNELPKDAQQQGLKIAESVDEPERIVMQYEITGKEVLSRTRWLGRNIPIFQFKGRTYYVKGEKRMFSAISPSIDSQAQLNYAESGVAEQMGSTVHTPYIGAVGSFKSRSQDWQRAAIKRFPFLEYDPVVITTPNGAVIAPPPAKQQTEPQIQAYLVAAQHAADNIRFTSGITKSAQGIDDRTAKSGIAKKVDAAESDNSAFDWHASGAQTLSLVGDAIVDVAPKIIPANELIQILDEQDKQKSILVNAEIENNPKTPPNQDKSHFLERGEYRVRVSAAPSNESIRKDTQEKLGEIYAEAPDQQKMALTAPLIRATDINGKDELADRVELPEFRKPAEGAAKVPPEAMAAIEEGHKLVEMGQQEIARLNRIIESKILELEAKKETSAADNQTKLAIAEINKAVVGFQEETASIRHTLDLMMQQAQMAQGQVENEAGRQHEQGMQADAQQHQAGMQSEQLTAQQQQAREAAAANGAQ